MSYLPPAPPTNTTTKLRKSLSISLLSAGSPGSPGFPGAPYVPPYRAFVTTRVCSYIPYTSAEISQLLLSQGARLVEAEPGVFVWVPGPSGSLQIPQGREVCRDEVRIVEYPAQPAIPPTPAVPPTPAQYKTDLQLGWNARAHSINAMQDSGVFRFKFTAKTQGTVCGLTPRPLNSGYADLLWAFFAAQGVLKIYEAGQEVQTVGSYTGQMLSITRRAGMIEYRVGSDLVRTTPNRSDPMYLSAALYAGGDEVLEASLSEFGSGSGGVTMSAAQILGGDTSYAQGEVRSLPVEMYGESTARGSVNLTLPRVQVLGAGAGAQYGQGSVVLQPATIEGETLAPPPEISVGLLSLTGLNMRGVGTSGGIGSGGIAMRPVAMLAADRPYAGGEVMLAPVTIYAENFGLQTEANMISVLLATQYVSPSQVLLALVMSATEVVGLVAAQVVLPQGMPNAVTVDDPVALQQELSALLQSVTSARFALNEKSAALETWVLHLDTNGSTRYDNFAFNSFAKVGERYYGANADGLFALEGPDDAGERIDASVDFGNVTFGTALRKGLPYCYVGVASNGRLVLKVEADGQTYYYDAQSTSEDMKQQRFKLGRGLRATYYHLTLINHGGSAFDLDTIEFMPLELNRRL